MGTMISQIIAYKLYNDPDKLMVFASLTGGLLILISEAQQSQRKPADLTPFGGILVTAGRHTSQLLFCGRILLIGLYFNLAFDFQAEMGWLRITLALLGLVFCIFIAVGFKAKYSAAFLLMILLGITVVTKNWLDPHLKTSKRDFLRYEFFQMISVAGGFLLLVLVGPGELSVDQVKED